MGKKVSRELCSKKGSIGTVCMNVKKEGEQTETILHLYKLCLLSLISGMLLLGTAKTTLAQDYDGVGYDERRSRHYFKISKSARDLMQLDFDSVITLNINQKRVAIKGQLSATTYVGDGSALTNLDASKIIYRN